MTTTHRGLRVIGAVLLAGTVVDARPSRVAQAPPEPAAKAAPSTAPAAVRSSRLEARLAQGRVVLDLYEPASRGRTPLVLVAHGFSRSRSNMAGWGRHLAAQGYLAAVPDLPAWSDHARNGRAINELLAWLPTHLPAGVSIDTTRIALVGFSAGGLATLLAAADNPLVGVWVGLDPVDRDGVGAEAARRVTARPFIITAEPSGCNANGNASAIARALGPRVTRTPVPGATHVDAEWPTDWKARLVCGGTSEARRALFAELTVAALRQAFAEPERP